MQRESAAELRGDMANGESSGAWGWVANFGEKNPLDRPDVEMGCPMSIQPRTELNVSPLSQHKRVLCLAQFPAHWGVLTARDCLTMRRMTTNLTFGHFSSSFLHTQLPLY